MSSEWFCACDIHRYSLTQFEVHVNAIASSIYIFCLSMNIVVRVKDKVMQLYDGDLYLFCKKCRLQKKQLIHSLALVLAHTLLSLVFLIL